MTQRMLVQQYETLRFQDMGYTDFWFDAGIGTGKTHVASRWVYRQIVEQPSYIVGFLGANDHDQLNMAVMPPLLEYLDQMNVEYMFNKAPKKSWGTKSRFERHSNILSLDTGHQLICKPMKDKHFHIPGIQIGYWWIDEIGDIPHSAMKKIRERRRQHGGTLVGLVTGTPNGPDHFSYLDYMNPATRLPGHGFTKASTREGVEAGWLTQDYLLLLEAQYSKKEGAARLDGEVVDQIGLRAYESHDTKLNCTRLNPFNGNRPGPNPAMPLGVFCDFNAVKKCMWTVGQFDHTRTHVIDEIALETTRADVMFRELIRRYGRWTQGFHFFGDASGTRPELSSGTSIFETVRNACFNEKIRVSFTTPKANPTRVDRIEAVNASLCSYSGEVTLTYDHINCPHLHLDFLRVGFDGVKLLDKGDPDRTHSSDGVGYHIVAIRPVRGPSYVPITGHGSYSGR